MTLKTEQMDTTEIGFLENNKKTEHKSKEGSLFQLSEGKDGVLLC